MYIENLYKIFLVCLLILIILNPYTVVGNLAYYAVIPFLLVGAICRFRYLGFDTFFLLGLMVLISVWGAFVSFANNIGQFIHLKVAAGLLLYVLVAHGVFAFFSRRGFNFNDFIYCALLAVVVNGLVIIFEVFFPDFRDLIEVVLVASGNVDWQEGFRYRGIASGGGASLSILIPVAVVMALHLYKDKYIGNISLLLNLAVLIFSLFFIGRTGVMLLPLVFISFVFFNFRRYFFHTFWLFLLITFVIVFGYEYFKQIVIDRYGVGFFDYSLGFLLEGSDGLKSEGTVDAILGFLKVVPTTFPEVVIGCGFYGEGEFFPWTDSGYSRMFLSVGYFFGLIFYACFLLMFRNVFLHKSFLFLTVGSLLLIAEAKEPLLFTGYASRTYFMLLVFGMLDKKMQQQNGRVGVDNIRHDGLVSGIS